LLKFCEFSLKFRYIADYESIRDQDKPDAKKYFGNREEQEFEKKTIKRSDIVEYMAFSAYIQGIQRFDVLLRILRDDLIFFAVQMCHRSKLQDW